MLFTFVQEKLVLAKEQEIIREHGRAARALANQSQPLSVCTILREDEIYNNMDYEQVSNALSVFVLINISKKLLCCVCQDLSF